MVIIKQNEDYAKILQLQYAETMLPLDLTDCTVYSEMRDKPGGTLAATAVCTLPSAEEGLIRVFYSAEQTAQIEQGEYGYDIWLVDADGLKHPLYTTRVKVVKSYTENLGGE